MTSDNQLLVNFEFSKQSNTVSLDDLTRAVVEFLDEYCVEHLVGHEFCETVGTGSGRQKFSQLLDASGCRGNVTAFFSELLPQLGRANHTKRLAISVGTTKLPYQLLLAIMEVILPGNRIVDIKSVSQYERLTNIRVPANEREAIKTVLHDFPVRLTMHTIRQMRLSPAVAYQYVPDTDELDPTGQAHTWVGQFHRGVLEQMYRNRLIFVLNMKCPVYCRFCFRKHKECRNQKAPTQTHVKQALAYIREATDIKEVVLTGGDPFMNRATLSSAIDGLSKIPHVRTLRAATRSLSYFPHLFASDGGTWLSFLKRKSLELAERKKRLEIATHFIHPDELSVQGLDCIAELVGSGIPVYVQTPFLANCNDEGPELTKLYTLLRSVGAEIHYIFIPCSPILGNKRYWKPIAAGLAAGRYLRAHLSDRAIPHITTATAIGKIDWQTSGWAVERDEERASDIWIRTPYTKEYFEPFAPLLQLGESVRDNAEGTLDCRFQTEIGDERLFGGSRTAVVTPKEHRPFEEQATLRDTLERLKHRALADQRSHYGVVSTGIPGCWRQHACRVEIDCEASPESHEQALTYIATDQRVTDIVISSRRDVTDNIFNALQFVERLVSVPHVRAVRIRSLKFNYAPERFNSALVRKLARYNRLDPATAVRLEVGTSFLHHDEFQQEHAQIAHRLRMRGITVYNETPLMAAVNDRPADILAIANCCRDYGIEFNAVFISGLLIQSSWSEDHPINIGDVIDIASHVRLFGSGREVPYYLFRTAAGEVDYGISTECIGCDDEGRPLLKLLTTTATDLRSLTAQYDAPDLVSIDDELDTVTVTIPGVRLITEVEQPV